MKVVIYQAPFAQTAFGYNGEADYKPVWGGDRPETTTLENIFAEFQRVDEDHMPPDDYTGRSLSVGDVVRLGDEAHAVEWVGFKRVGDFVSGVSTTPS